MLQLELCIHTHPKAQEPGCSQDAEGDGEYEELYDAMGLRTRDSSG
jgi:hypothetical protein